MGFGQGVVATVAVKGCHCASCSNRWEVNVKLGRVWWLRLNAGSAVVSIIYLDIIIIVLYFSFSGCKVRVFRRVFRYTPGGTEAVGPFHGGAGKYRERSPKAEDVRGFNNGSQVYMALVVL